MSVISLNRIVRDLRHQVPGLSLHAKESATFIALQNIRVPNRLQGMGIGSSCIEKIKAFARRIGKPIKLDFSPDDDHYHDLLRFYQRHGFRWSGKKVNGFDEMIWTWKKEGDLRPETDFKTALQSRQVRPYSIR